VRNEGSASDDRIAVLERVTKSYGRFRALSDITFSVKEGEIFGYIGPNGAGKTTTIKILVGLIRDFGGTATIASGSSRVQSNRALGYLPQHASSQEWRTVNPALTTLGGLSGMSIQVADGQIPVVSELLGITDTRERKVVHLSGGTIQKVGMAQAILHDAQLGRQEMCLIRRATRSVWKTVHTRLCLRVHRP
jgi:ABC-2 type transport system ATP-binding protein